MRVAIEPLEAEADTEAADHSALRLMLSYVQAECLRIGATDAARHIAQAASLMSHGIDGGAAQPLAWLRNARLH
jgi:hypothetical protein